MLLTKTKFIQFLQCEKYLWLDSYSPELHEPFDATEFQKSEGYQVETLAYQLFPEGVVAKNGSDAFLTTTKLMKQKTSAIFQASIQDNDILCRSDIIAFDRQKNSWDIYEVKASTEVKDHHLLDVAFQKFCYKRCGITIGNCFIVLVNNKYVRQGDILPSQLLKIENVSSLAEDLLPDTKSFVADALKTLQQTKEPEVLMLKQCKSPYECPFIPYCWKDFPKNSIYTLAGGLKAEHLEILVKAKKLNIATIPEEFLTKKLGKRHHYAVVSNKTTVDKKNIAKEVKDLVYPLAFLDYETFAPAIPLLDGYRPYQRMIFQYSLHILHEDGRCEHKEFLANTLDQVGGALATQLQDDLPKTGTVIVWNKAFEKGCNSEMAEMFPNLKTFLEGVNDRIYDLLDIFKKGYYIDPRFNGSNSIKSVLPVLVPTLSYKTLTIQEGGTASHTWATLMTDTAIPHEQKEEQLHHLLAYCKLDTLAMVEIYQFLLKSIR